MTDTRLSSDIVERLRGWPAFEQRADVFSSHFVSAMLKEAANEIERLRGAAQAAPEPALIRRAESSIKCLRAPDPALKAVPNTIRQSLAEVLEQLLAAHPTQGGDKGDAVAWRKIVEECARLVEQHEPEMRMAETTMTARGVSAIAQGLLSRWDHDQFGLPSAPPPTTAATNHIEKTPTGIVDWKLEVGRLNQIIARLESLGVSDPAYAQRIPRELNSTSEFNK